MNSFKRNLSIKNKNSIHNSYSNILLTIFESFLLRILFNPCNLIDLNTPVMVSRTIAAPTAISIPYTGANNKIIDADIYCRYFIAPDPYMVFYRAYYPYYY